MNATVPANRGLVLVEVFGAFHLRKWKGETSALLLTGALLPDDLSWFPAVSLCFAGISFLLAWLKDVLAKFWDLNYPHPVTDPIPRRDYLLL